MLCSLGEEGLVAECFKKHALSFSKNLPDLCKLEPKEFVERVIEGNLAIDDGDWIQPIFKKRRGVWLLHKFEVLYRMNDAFGVPFPAFVNFVKTASDQSSNADPDLRQAFRNHAVASLRRVDARVSQLKAKQRAAMIELGILTNLNFTAKQMEAVLTVPLQNSKLLAVEETEYDDAPQNLSAVRHGIWQRMGALSLDDVKPTKAEVAAYADGPLNYNPPRTPSGAPFKPLAETYNHDFAFARRFIRDFQRARQDNPSAKADLKLDEEFCCYLIGVGHAPFARQAMAQWREQYPQASEAARNAGLDLIREALVAGMGICLETSFEDDEVQWLRDRVPELDRRLYKQGGRSGAAALPHSMFESELLVPLSDL
jgi:hypothetical protein